MREELTCEARVRFRGRDLQMNKIVADVEIQDIAPARSPAFDFNDLQHRAEAAERRRRLIDMIAAQIACALTEAIFEMEKP